MNMRDIARWCLLPLLVALPLVSAAQSAATAPAEPPGCSPAAQRINEERFISLGGIEQWVTIKGASCANPVILFLHGGPGNTMSPYASTIYGAWEKEFTLVQWDQRGAGMTFGRNPQTAGSELTIERMTQDGLELAAHLARYLGQQKIILVGGSWSSVLGVHMVKARPDLFYAFISSGQLVSYRENQRASYRKVLHLACAAGDVETVAALEALGPPPWEKPRNFGILRRATRVYEAKKSTPAPASWWVPEAQYATPKFQAEYEQGEDYSYLQFVGVNGKGMFSRVDLPALGTQFSIPVFFVQGSEDLVTLPEVAKRYFDAITAPQKEFILLPQTGHDPNAAMVEAQYSLLKKRIVPLLN
jgi:pimeloyl-ACP methyl ester carboxylesterase